MHFLQTEYAQKLRTKCLKSKDHERNPTVSGVQSGVAKSKVYISDTYVTMPITSGVQL